MTAAGRRELRDELLAVIPRWYSPWGHLLFPTLVGVAILIGAIDHLRGVRAWQVALVPVFWIIGNAVEWHAHRGLLHRGMRLVDVLYVRHTQHHKVYVTDSMAIREIRELKLVLLPAAGVLALFTFTLPVAAILLVEGQRNVALLWIATAVAYVLSYEWLHLAYHLPPESPVGGLAIVRALRRHHAMHHSPALMQRWNFNITVPLWDWVRGTIYRAPSPAPSRTPVPAPRTPARPPVRTF